MDPNATQAQKMDARLTGAEIKAEAIANMFIFLNVGKDANAVQPSADAPTDVEGRLSNLEKTQDVIEQKMPELAKRSDVVYTPYEKPASSEPPTEQSRMENIEKRQAYIQKKLDVAKFVLQARAKENSGV